MKSNYHFTGHSQLYKWNSTYFQYLATFPSTHARDAVVYPDAVNGSTLVIMSDVNNATSVWSVTSTGVHRRTSLEVKSDTIEVLRFGMTSYLALASRSTATSSSGFVHLFRLVEVCNK